MWKQIQIKILNVNVITNDKYNEQDVCKTTIFYADKMVERVSREQVSFICLADGFDDSAKLIWQVDMIIDYGRVC